jgi:hypothetical protein
MALGQLGQNRMRTQIHGRHASVALGRQRADNSDVLQDADLQLVPAMDRAGEAIDS